MYCPPFWRRYSGDPYVSLNAFAVLSVLAATVAFVFNSPRTTELSDRELFEILLLARGVGRKRLHVLNTRAIEEGVNLADPRQRRRIDASDGSQRTRCAVHRSLCETD